MSDFLEAHDLLGMTRKYFKLECNGMQTHGLENAKKLSRRML